MTSFPPPFSYTLSLPHLHPRSRLHPLARVVFILSCRYGPSLNFPVPCHTLLSSTVSGVLRSWSNFRLCFKSVDRLCPFQGREKGKCPTKRSRRPDARKGSPRGYEEIFVSPDSSFCSAEFFTERRCIWRGTCDSERPWASSVNQ